MQRFSIFLTMFDLSWNSMSQCDSKKELQNEMQVNRRASKGNFGFNGE